MLSAVGKGTTVTGIYLSNKKHINAYDKQINQHLNKFDINSDRTGIDNRCSACIWNKIDNFIVLLKGFNIFIKGFGSERVYNVKM